MPTRIVPPLFRARGVVAAGAAAALVAASGWAQQAEQAAAGAPLAVGDPVEGALEAGGSESYSIELAAGRFVYGRAGQVTVDVVVRVFDPSGERIAEFDGPARGWETFQFDTEQAGTYRIEIAPFEGAEGEYTLELLRAEPLATTPEGRVDQLMAPYSPADVPGGVVAVVRDGEIAFARAYGAANLTHGAPFEIGTRTNIGSTSKQFTAFAVALLAERGELSLDDDVRKHIPELPDLGETVTLRHLLTHTSGYREFLNTLLMAGRRIDRGDSIDRSELIEVVQRQPELQNSPGAEWNYNNTGYGLLTIVVERVTGESFPDWMRENVFEPLGMHDTVVRQNPAQLIVNAAQGYAPAEQGGYQIAEDLGGAMGAGGIYTTVEDLAKWIRNFRTHELGSEGLFELMTTPYELSGGKPSGYGLGLFIDELRGLRRIHHGGADTAHRSMIMYFPELDGAVITQSNNASFNGTIANEVAEAFFGESMAAEEATIDTSAADASTFDPSSFDPASFDAFAGRYELEEMPGFVMTFTREGDRYFAQATRQPKLEIFPTSANSFKFDVVEAAITFHAGDDGAVDSLTLHQNGEHRAKRLAEEPWSPDAAALEGYAGRYFSEELETFYDVVVEEGALVIRHRRLDDIKLAPAKEQRFTGGMPVAEVVFGKDASGRVAWLEASNGRTRGVRFERVE